MGVLNVLGVIAIEEHSNFAATSVLAERDAVTLRLEVVMVLSLISSEADVRLETVSVLILRLRLIKLEIRAVLVAK